MSRSQGICTHVVLNWRHIGVTFEVRSSCKFARIGVFRRAFVRSFLLRSQQLLDNMLKTNLKFSSHAVAVCCMLSQGDVW